MYDRRTRIARKTRQRRNKKEPPVTHWRDACKRYARSDFVQQLRSEPNLTAAAKRLTDDGNETLRAAVVCGLTFTVGSTVVLY